MTPESEQGSGGSYSMRRRIRSCLTTVVHGSAPFIAVFAMIHLTAPVMANIGGTSLSSNVMLFGREYYQTPFGEKYLVLAPLLIHPLAAIAKRILSPHPLAEPRPLKSSVLSQSAYLALFVFLPVHYLTHRVYPSLDGPPVYGVGPAELDYEFVKTGLRVWPWRAWGLYLGLGVCVGVHIRMGIGVIWRRWVRMRTGGGNDASGGALSGRWRSVVGGVLMVVPVMSGVWVMSREPVFAMSSTVERFVAAFSKSVVYRVG